MKLAFIVDPLVALKAYKDSSVAMMRAAAGRGHEIWTIQRASLCCRDGRVAADCLRIEPQADVTNWFTAGAMEKLPLTAFDAVLMRQDPPFDAEYVAATWLLEQAERQGARVFNRPQAIRDHSEKVAIAEFPQFTPPTLIARQMADVQAFIEAHGDTVLKPLDGMGGAGVFRVRHDDPNRNVIVETLTAHGQRTMMAQRYLPAIVDGDKRILLIAGEPVPWVLARIPQAGDMRGNLATGARGEARSLTPRDREIAVALAPTLWARGILLAGLDVIGDCLTEINVTSPTCFVEIAQQTGFDVAGRFVDALEVACAV
ncbi:MAG: glutathione synthase [Gammaproteobacteria bacterium]|nr:glutathione synthase [Rhodocyclaceae bacterium]MBU3910250.1 glutathione synthase [Gammaproteobacteria bacterium]MBU3989445.1 glutathione synthase [Gammaproteobacteria bacterium]MBU4005420.1 glutathione synthase [Gammaproteobacteria bacterium]MBU4022712.1 glutathione synthase [Gammaproteobacteria bacterium]